MAAQQISSSQSSIFSGPLFPVVAISVDPIGLGTADCDSIGRCDDGCDYALKDGKKDPLIPHSEWFCTRLAELVGIACPPCKTIKMPDGSFVFGSRWEGGAKVKWYEKVISNELKIADASPVVSRIYAYDHFIHNVDRHGANFLTREKQSGWSILAFDWSRSWLCGGFPLPALPMDTSKTVIVQRQITKVIKSKYIDSNEANKTLDKLKTVPVNEIEKIINEHPATWLPQQNRDDILTWWGSAAMLARADEIKKGIGDGSYL